jgi:hypothetical protein
VGEKPRNAVNAAKKKVNAAVNAAKKKVNAV